MSIQLSLAYAHCCMIGCKGYAFSLQNSERFYWDGCISYGIMHGALEEPSEVEDRGNVIIAYS